MKDLPMLPSTEKEYKDKIKSLQNELDSVYASALRFATGVINRSSLSTEDKTDLINQLWEK
jgi:hypothetical protein